MSKKVSINFRLEPELRDRFSAAAKLDRRPASQVLRELIHSYIGDVERKHGPVTKRSAWQTLARRKDLANAKASIELSGFKIPDEMEAIAEQFMRDEVSIDAVLAKADELTGK